MFSRPLAFVLLALGCVTAAAGGAYVATRQNATEVVSSAAPAPAPAPAAAPVAPAEPAAQPVAETEAAVSSLKAEMPPAVRKTPKAESAPPAPRRPEMVAAKPAAAPKPQNTARNEPAGRTVPLNGATPAGQPQPEAQLPPVQAVQPPAPEPSRPVEPQPEAPRVPQFEEVILPAASVIGLQLEGAVSSERARLEDRVEARVSRDVMAAGRVAIPAGARVVGSVVAVDTGGKVKTPARVGIRFHTLVLADGSEVGLRTEPIYRDGESPAGNSAKKIGGAAVAGAILGGILGGSKGAAIGGATGAAGGTASVMSGDRAAVNMPSGTFLNAKLSSPATITVERRE
jgi:hypothetical protein